MKIETTGKKRFETKSKWETKTTKEIIDDLSKWVEAFKNIKPPPKTIMIISETAEKEESFLNLVKEHNWIKCDDGTYRSYFNDRVVHVMPDHWMPLDATGEPRKSVVMRDYSAPHSIDHSKIREIKIQKGQSMGYTVFGDKNNV